jgi:hypothetical protein
MSGNFNFAIDHVESGWVTSVGDDDAIMPGALRHAAEIIKTYAALPISAPSVYYCWPGLASAELAHRLQFSAFSSKTEVRDSRQTIQKRIEFTEKKEGYIWGMPGIYRGFVPMDLVKASIRGGRYINSVTPDAYSAFATTLLSEKFVHTDRPLFVEGVSAKSNGAAQSVLSDTNEEQRYIAENDIEINDRMVYCAASSFVMIEAFLQAKAAFPDRSNGLDPDFQAMCIRARLETIPNKIGSVQRAIDAIRKLHRLPSEPKISALLESWHRRRDSIQRALTGLVLDGDAFDIQNVYEASLVAGAIWNYKSATGHEEGLSLLTSRLKKFFARRAGRLSDL